MGQPAGDTPRAVRDTPEQTGVSDSEVEKTLRQPVVDSSRPMPRLPADVTINKNAGRGDHLFVTLRLEDGRSLPFSVDTGSPVTLIDTSLEPQLGRRFGTMPVGMVGHGKKASGLYAAPRLSVGEVPLMTGSNIFAYPFKQPGGILGMDCLTHYCIQLDFQAGEMRFLDSDGLNTADLGKAFPIRLVHTAAKGEIALPMIQHTGLFGADTNLLIDTGCRIDGLTSKGAVFKVAWAWFLSLFGAGRLHACVWDGDTYRNIKLVPVDHANVLGLRFLARHLVTLDFPKHTIYLKQTSIYPLSGVERETPPSQNAAANASQPIRSETNRTSSAAGSGR
jgi:hypothetical protein